MNKPLTIDELKSLETGDWVWLVKLQPIKFHKYVIKRGNSKTWFSYDAFDSIQYSGYGKTWLAYKNKEQEECMGEIVELIAPLDSELWEIECPKYKDDKGNIWTSLTYKDAKVVKSKYKLSLSNYGMLLKGHYFLTEKEAEARLKELRGEK